MVRVLAEDLRQLMDLRRLLEHTPDGATPRCDQFGLEECCAPPRHTSD